jgi:hemoglobin/transferrin/lactoferrin receptor protein
MLPLTQKYPLLFFFILTCVSLFNTVNAEQIKKPLVTFNLPEGKLSDSIRSYSRQAKLTLSYNEYVLRGFSVPAIAGDYAPVDVLFRLLEGTKLQAIPVGKGAWLIQSSANNNAVILDTIKVQSRGEAIQDQAFRESASVSVLTQETIERFRGTSVGDIFQGTTGVLVSENRNSGGLDINIRGMQGQGRVPVLIDGSRQETTVYRGYSGVSSRSYIDPDLIGTIRISKGPVITEQGTGATGGLVSVNTLRAEDIIEGDDLVGARFRASGMSNNSPEPAAGTYAGYYLPRNAYRSECRFPTYCTKKHLMPDGFAPDDGMDRPSLLDFGGYASSLALAKRFDWGDIVAAYAKRKQGNYYAGTKGSPPSIIIGESDKLAWYTETPVSMTGVSRFRAGERIPNTNFSSQSLLLKSRLYLPQDHSLEFSYIRYDSAYGEMMPSQIKSFGQARQWLDSEVLNQTYTARYRWQPMAYDWADFKVNLWHTDAVTDLNTPGVGSVDVANNTARTDNYLRWGADITNSMRFYPMGELLVDYGLSGQWEDMDTDTPQSVGFYTGSRSGGRREFSAFTALKWKPWQQWTFKAGIRYTSFNSKDNNPLPLSTNDPACQPDGEDGCLPVLYRNSHSGSAPLMSITWEPLDGLQFYLRHAQALRMPSLFENTSGWSVSPALDIPLRPEHAKNNEFGINYLNNELFQAKHKLRAKFAYFDNKVEDYLTRTQPNAWEQKQDGFDFFRLRNIDSLELKGVEFDLNYDAHTWLFEINGTKYTHIEVCNVGSYVRYYCNDWGLPQSYINNMIPPNWHASVHLGARLMQQRLEVGIRSTLMGKRNSIPRYNAPTGFNKPVLWQTYQLYDLYTKFKYSDRIAIDFAIDNLTDRYYLDALSLGLVPAPGRTARLGINIQF